MNLQYIKTLKFCWTYWGFLHDHKNDKWIIYFYELTEFYEAILNPVLTIYTKPKHRMFATQNLKPLHKNFSEFQSRKIPFYGYRRTRTWWWSNLAFSGPTAWTVLTEPTWSSPWSPSDRFRRNWGSWEFWTPRRPLSSRSVVLNLN